MNETTYVSVPCVCTGRITSKLEDQNGLFEVQIHKSPTGDFTAPIHCDLIYSPGTEGNFKVGHTVKVLVNFWYGGVERGYKDVDHSRGHYILGLYNEKSIMGDVGTDHPIAYNDSDRMGLKNPISLAALVLTDSGSAQLVSGGATSLLLTSFGNGLNENSCRITAQNHHRIVGQNGPFYLAREHFGVYLGANDDDKMSKATPEDCLVSYRRFVTQSQSIENYVSTCEGAFNPWLGPNNDSDSITKGRETLFAKIVNYKDKRLTIEAGEPGEEFVKIRIDDVINPEKDASGSASPATVGNRFKLTISDEGEVVLRAGGKGIPSSNQNAFALKITADGDLLINTANSIVMTHGDQDEPQNSIKMSKDSGIEIMAKKGMKVNGVELVTKAYLDWMQKYQAALCQVTTIGGPAPIHPSALPEFTSGLSSPMAANGFTTTEVSGAPTGIIQDQDSHTSSA